MTDDVTQHFIDKIIQADINAGKHGGNVLTRFPPEPNGYLHVGHAKSICLNFGMALKYQGQCNLRFDDTNPATEEERFAHAIEDDVKWLGYEWAGEPKHASDYFQQLYEFAVQLITQGQAYVCELTFDQMRVYRGTLTELGKPSPYRDRPIADNLDLFERMKGGEFPEGSLVLRAKIDMQSPNLNMRDPVLYRVRHLDHQRTGKTWCIYPMYDFTHGISDALEGITHSLCTLEFQDHRPLYEWFLEHLTLPARPQQIEFSRLNLSHTVTSKRKLKQLVEENRVQGWDDPRMPTLVGMRRRGYPAESIRKFCEMIGISKSDSVIDMSVLEECVRETLNAQAKRAMCVLRPLRVIIDNYPSDTVEMLTAAAHPQQEALGTRQLPFSKELWIEQDDFREEPPKDYHRLAPGKEVRLRNAYVIRCDSVEKNEAGDITALHCHYDPATLGKNPEGRKVKGVIHWVSAAQALPIEVRCYDRLFSVTDPGSVDNLGSVLNPESLIALSGCFLEPDLKQAQPGDCFQFERIGYFCVDKDTCSNRLIFNQVVSLRDSWQEKS